MMATVVGRVEHVWGEPQQFNETPRLVRFCRVCGKMRMGVAAHSACVGPPIRKLEKPQKAAQYLPPSVEVVRETQGKLQEMAMNADISGAFLELLDWDDMTGIVHNHDAAVVNLMRMLLGKDPLYSFS